MSVKALIISGDWQAFAHNCRTVFSQIVMPQFGRHCILGSHQRSRLRRGDTPDFPVPSQRFAPSQAGPSLAIWQACADCCGALRFRFEFRRVAVESRLITTTHRGSLKCANRLSSLPFLPFHWPAACRIPRRAVPPVQLPVPLSPTQPKTTCLPVRSLAVWPGLQPAGSNWACRPAARNTDLTACGQKRATAKAIRAGRPGGFSICVPGRA